MKPPLVQRVIQYALVQSFLMRKPWLCRFVLDIQEAQLHYHENIPFLVSRNKLEWPDFNHFI